ncbi:hypothetical protein [Pseudoalteromonas agarivorans]|uniref:Lipoprotein n=1 Tax=Pseudoalteromonas agarivorans TaxID=176102 RepID=A0AAD0U3H9_9GAMM|nr:hypothetical protein [Pseudoalteromonas agarivorans]AYM88973.1 hypothetical protein D9T18_19940 [Pseudoalteromonas agarivorans]
MSTFKTLAAFLAVSALSGCATSTTPMEYMNNHSEAYNIAHAGGLVTDIKDTYVPADSVGSITESMLNLGFVAGGYGSPQLGMTNWQTAGVHLLGNLLEPDSHGARNSLIAWMPASEASSTEEAQEKFLSHVKVSIEKVMVELGLKHETIYDQNGKLSIYFIKDEWNCPEYSHGITDISDLCEVSVETYEPYKAISPSFISGIESESYIFSPNDGRDFHNLNLITNKKSSVPEDEIYTSISEELSSWTYIYIAPKKVKMKNGETINYPYILNKGQKKLFITPKK